MMQEIHHEVSISLKGFIEPLVKPVKEFPDKAYLIC